MRGKRSTSSLVKVLPWRLMPSIEIVSRPSIVRNPYRSGLGALQESDETTALRKKQISAACPRIDRTLAAAYAITNAMPLHPSDSNTLDNSLPLSVTGATTALGI